MYAQPIFAAVERQVAAQWPDAKFINRVHTISIPFFNSTLRFTLSKLIFRSIIVLVTTLVAMIVPFFNAVLGLLGALSFWPLTVYFPISMHIAQEKIGREVPKWYFLHGLSIFCLMISIAVSIGSVVDIASSLKMSAPFKTVGWVLVLRLCQKNKVCFKFYNHDWREQSVAWARNEHKLACIVSKI